MPRRTPILALLLAPVALVLVMLVWRDALVPLYRTVWFSDTVLRWRLDSSQPATRIAAARDVGSSDTEDTALLGELVVHLETDDSAEVRKVAATTLGHLGRKRPLPADALGALGAVILTEQDEALLSAAVGAVGQSALNNRYPDPVVERLAGILNEEHLTFLYPAAATTLGQVGAAQPLPDAVFEAMNAVFADPDHPNEREYLVNAFTEIAKGQRLPVSTLELLAGAFENESNPRLRRGLIYALAHAAADYPPAVTLISEATHDPDPSVVGAAEGGLRIIEYDRNFADKDPLSLAMDSSQALEVRRDALRILRSSPIEPANLEQIATLAQDPRPEVAVAALEMFHHLARAPDDDFDQRVLIPQLTRSMSDPNPLIREAAYGALSAISIHRPSYLRAGDFPAQLETGAKDPTPKVRVIALLAMLGDASGVAQRDALLERGLTDPDPYVRRMAVSWLGSPRIKTDRRLELIDRALGDSDPQVRATATASQQDWDSRPRAWPVELWQLWRAGEHGQVGMRILVAVTVATPILICGIFLLYYIARLLTLMQQRRWRAAAVVPIVAIWAAASYGMFMLYFVAAHAGDADGGELAILTAILWGAIVVYTGLGWGLHYAVRR